VDYKGGAAFDACARLPHVVGMVTDLDEHLGARALRSLEAELRHRERTLRRADAADLPAYLAAGAPLGPLPRLVVVVDEFATLATDLPDFLGALVGVAQRGRSLGVHLVLATQRPRGAVNANIRANTNLRIALRVQDPAESLDVIDGPDAAAIGRATPGRAYVRRGAGEVEAVQTALATAPPARATGLRVTPLAFAPTPPSLPGSPSAPTAAPTGAGSELSKLVDAACAAFAHTGQPLPRRPWLPMLPADLPLGEVARWDGPGVPGASAGSDPADGAVLFARADDPDHQRTVRVGWDPTEGHLALHGMVGSGTTTAAVAVVLRLCAARGPDDCHVYGIDYGGGLTPLAGLPQVGSIIGAGEREAQCRLVRRLRSELDRRRDLGPDRLAAEPLLVTVVDGVGGFLAEHEGVESVELADGFRRLVADGPAVRIVLVLAADRVGALPLRMASSVAQRMLFRLADPNEFAAVGLRPRQLPAFVPGRAVHGPSGLVAQVGRPADVAAEVARVAAAWPRPAVTRPPAPIRILPTRVDAADLPAARSDGRRLILPVGLAEDDLAPVALTLAPGEHALVAGGPQAGTSTALALLAHQLRRADPDAVLVGVSAEDGPLFAVDDLDAAGPADELADVLARAAGHHRRWVVLVDDAPRADDRSGVLAGLVAARRPGLHVVAGGRIDELRRALTHWTRAVRSSRTGLLLGPDLATDGDVLGVRLPRRVPVAMATGRGFVVASGRPALAQIALPARTPVPGRT
jgi:S-DNA-T family DNA segregation ATPase FtsK/SpoIIIE